MARNVGYARRGWRKDAEVKASGPSGEEASKLPGGNITINVRSEGMDHEIAIVSRTKLRLSKSSRNLKLFGPVSVVKAFLIGARACIPVNLSRLYADVKCYTRRVRIQLHDRLVFVSVRFEL